MSKAEKPELKRLPDVARKISLVGKRPRGCKTHSEGRVPLFRHNIRGAGKPWRRRHTLVARAVCPQFTPRMFTYRPADLCQR
jgi:hypothetical protein